MLYPIILTLHLLCAILFIGVVFFEVALLEGIRIRLGAQLMDAVETALIQRARQIMPWVVGTLFLSGLFLGHNHFQTMNLSWSDSFTVLFTAKIILAISVLIHFVSAIRAQATGCMTSTRFRNTHLSVAIHMVLIVVLAKMMFYVSW